MSDVHHTLSRCFAGLRQVRAVSPELFDSVQQHPPLSTRLHSEQRCGLVLPLL